MSIRISAKSTEQTLRDKFAEDGKLLADFSTLATFATTAASGEPIGLVAGAALILKTAGAAISAGTSILRRLADQKGDTGEDVLPAYDRFRIVFFVAVQKSFIEALTEAVTGVKPDAKQRPADAKMSAEEAKQLRERLKMMMASLSEAEVSYLFCVEPLGSDVPLYSAFENWTATTLTYYGFSSHKSLEISRKSSEDARKRFHVYLSGKDEAAAWMRNYLAIASQRDVSSKLLGELDEIKETLKSWTEPTRALKQAQQEAWDGYRKTLEKLPDQKETMFSEQFGVRRVFIQPQVQYHIRGAPGDAGHPQGIQHLGKLFGALLSSRTSGEDLIILSGGPGSGKSTLCRVLASALAADPNVYPLFIRLRRMKEGAEIAQHIEETLQKLGAINRLSDLNSIANLVLILDGFDELVMASKSRLRHFFNVLREDLSAGPLRNAKAIISGRDTLFPRGEGLPLGSHVLSLQPFDKRRVKAWGTKWRLLHKSGPGSTFRPEDLMEDEASHRTKPPLHHLVSWPLTLHLVARVHTAGKLDMAGKGTKRLEKAYLYRSILAETSQRQMEQTEGTGRLDPRKMREFLRSLAWEMHSRSIDSMDPADVMPLLRRFYPDKGEQDLAELAEVAVVNSPELTKGEETGFEFVHKSFAEFLVGERVAELVERVAFKVAEYGTGELTWRMSEQEAVRELAPILGTRMVPYEVQEMFQPMLGAFESFCKEERIEGERAIAGRVDGLNRIIDRFEVLYQECTRTNALDTVRSTVDTGNSRRSSLDIAANYLAGLLVIGTAACRELRKYTNKNSRAFEGEPFRGAFWRSLCILAAGGLILDEVLAERILPGLRVKSDEASPVGDLEIPIKVGYLHEVANYTSSLTELVSRALAYIGFELRQRVLYQIMGKDPRAPRDLMMGGEIVYEFGSGRVVVPDIRGHPVVQLIRHLSQSGLIAKGLDWQADELMARLRHDLDDVIFKGSSEGVPKEALHQWMYLMERQLREVPDWPMGEHELRMVERRIGLRREK